MVAIGGAVRLGAAAVDPELQERCSLHPKQAVAVTAKYMISGCFLHVAWSR